MSPRAAFHRQPQVVHQATKVIQDTRAKEHIHIPEKKLTKWQQLKMDKGLVAAALITVFSLFRRGAGRSVTQAHVQEEIKPDLSSWEKMEANNAKFPSRKKRLKAHAMAWGINPHLPREKRKKRWAPIHRARITIQQMNTRRKINSILGQRVITHQDAQLLDQLEAELEQGHGR